MGCGKFVFLLYFCRKENEKDMKNVLVTGADGFIGSHLVELLLGEGYNVRALSFYNSFNYWGWLDDVHHERLEVVCGDVRDPNF